MKRKISSKAAFKFKAAAGNNHPAKAIEEAYVVAFKKGYSTVEIARLGGFKSAKFVHAALVKNGIIPPGKPGRQPKGSIPPKMRIHLTTRGLTYSQWCSGWGFDQTDAKKEVDARSGAAMAAIKVDFPGYYKLLTGEEVTDYTRPSAPFEKQILSAAINWDEAEGCYRADVLPSGSVGYGETVQMALNAAMVGSWTCEIAKRLIALPHKKELERELVW